MKRAQGRLSSSVPALHWLPRYDRRWLRPDIVAALTLWALVVPQAIAYAQIAGLPPQAGLFATFAGLLGYGLLGTCRQLVVSPTSSTAAISAALVAPMAGGDVARYGALSATLAILMGGVLVILGLLGMGFVSRFIAEAVTTGFMFGLGLTIIAGQVPALLGLPPGDDSDFFPQAGHIVSHLGDASAWTMAIGLGGLFVILALRRTVPAFPAALAVVVAGIVLVALLDLAGEGVRVIGAVDSTLPSPAVPRVGWDEIVGLLPGALVIAVIGYAESTTVAESMADRHAYDIRPDQELVAVGSANVLSGLFQGFIIGGGASQSAANDRAGARSQLAGLGVAALVVLTMVALLPLFEDLPQAVLAAIVISAVLAFLNVPAMKRIAKLRRDSFGVAVLAAAGVLVLGVLAGLVLAVAISLVLLLLHLSRPRFSVLGRLPGTDAYVAVDQWPDAQVEAGITVYRMDAPMLFVNAKRLREQVRARLAADSAARSVILDLTFTPELDIGSVDVLTALLGDVREHGSELWLANVHAGVRDILRRSGFEDAAGASHICRTVDDAMRACGRGEERGT